MANASRSDSSTLDAQGGIGPANAFARGSPSHTDGPDLWGQPYSHPPAHASSTHANSARLPEAQQDAIVRNRHSSVAQKFGQITPPNDATVPAAGKRKSSGSSSQAAPTPKMNSSERARNAAVKRHAKSKAARDAQLLNGSANPNGVPGKPADDKRELYREKNRQAAAKCRSKKKVNIEELEARHRELSAQNTYWKSQARQCRDMLSEMRELALQHDTDSCACRNVHAYNMRKASEVVFGLSQHVSSPSDVNSMPSPEDFDTMALHQSMSEGLSFNSASAPSSRPNSFAGPRDYAFAAVTTPATMQGAMQVTAPADDAANPFASYLHSSSNGRTGSA